MSYLISEAIIISKTKMENNFCMSAIDLTSKKNIRLMAAGLNYFPPSKDLEIGNLVKLKYEKKRHIIPPHTEDVIVADYKLIGEIDDIANFILNNKLINWKGDIHSVFDGLIHWSMGGAGFIPEIGPLPSHSVGFWLPDNPLTKLEEKKGIYYRVLNKKRYYLNKKIKYVGLEIPLDEIKNKIVRLSLSRIFPKEPKQNISRGFYLQISGWY